MKRLYYSLIAITALLVSCNKTEQFAPEKEQANVVENEKVMTIAATIEETKATYTDTGIFSWENGDEISYILRNVDEHYDGNTLTTSGSGSTVTFTGSTTATNYTAVDLAFYPKNRGQEGVNNNTLTVNNTGSVKTLQASLAGTITAREDRLSRIIPMIGKKTGVDPSGTVEQYHFYPVTGILKVSFTGLPATANKIRLDMPDNATYALNGTFNIDTSRETPEIKESDCVGTKWGQKHINFTYASSTDAFYFPIPTGTIPAGKLTVSVSDGTNIIYSVTCKKEITLNRGEITELPSITLCPVLVSASGTSSAIIANLTFGDPTAKAKVVLAESISAGQTLIDNEDASVQTLTETGPTTALSADNVSGSKQCYIVVRTYDSSEKTRGTYSVPVYTLSTTDAELLGQYTHTTSSTCKAGGSVDIPGEASFTIVVSDNPTTSNMMVSEFDGMTCTSKVPGIYNPGNKTVTWDNFSNPFDKVSPQKRFARASGMDTKLNFVFTLGSPNTFYADANFGYVVNDSYPWAWQYFYNAGNTHVYSQK